MEDVMVIEGGVGLMRAEEVAVGECEGDGRGS